MGIQFERAVSMPRGPIWRYGAEMGLNEVKGFLAECNTSTDFPRRAPVGELNRLSANKPSGKSEVIGF
ncbi:hypothetical protein [Brevundimonas pondensis]|uniref:Four helix bundle protein n=1 Tax=Brevundimonas pondensis TaxID=2774189 RepID=A0ABX7SFL4_9CAUL|nr:hypothetical protein [Brevundimonas pondensis]QTC86302.1 hypothetical protein IFE19_08935 [Brevundimonas pondensis]